MFKFLKKKQEPTAVQNEDLSQIRKSISIEDIKDEDMMVAALVAAIDYQQIVNSDIRLISIKQIS